MAAITLNDLNNNLEQQNHILENVQKSSEKMSNSLMSFIKSLSKFEGDKLEAEREGTGKVAGAAAGGGFLGGLADNLPFAGLFKGLLPIIAGIGGALIASFTEFGNDLARTFASIFVIDKFMVGINKIKTFFAAEGRFMKFLDDINVRLFVMADDAVKAVMGFLKSNILTAPIVGGIKLIGTGIADNLKFIFGPLVKGAQLISTGIADNIRPLFSFLGKIGSSAKGVVEFIAESGIGKMLGTLGTVLQKIFLPIGLIFTAYDVIKEAIAGYEEGGIGGAIGGAIKGLLASVVGAPLDLLRSGVAWILDKVGMEGAADYLKSFNVSDMIGRAIDSIPFMFKSAINGILEAVAQALESTVLTRGFADDVRDLKFEIKKPEVPAAEDVAKQVSEDNVTSSQTLPDGTTITKGVDADGFEYTETKRPTTKATIAGSGSGAVPAGNLKNETDEMNQRAGQSTTPVIIQDNSSRVTGGSSSQGVVMSTNPFDQYDPMVRA